MKLKRQITNVNFQANEVKQVDIPRSSIIESINCVLEIELENTDAVNPATIPSFDSWVWGKLGRLIDIIGDGQKYLFHQPMRDMILLDNFEHGIKPYYVNFATIAASGTETIKVGFKIDFQTKNSMIPDQTLLIAPDFSDLVMRVNWADKADITDGVSSLPASVNIKTANLTPVITEIPLTDVDEINVALKQERFMEANLALSNSADYSLPTGTAIRRIAIIPTDETDIRELVTQVQVIVNGNEYVRTIDTDNLILENLQFYKNNSLPLSHCVILNFDEDGDLSDLLDGTTASDLKLRFSTKVATTLHIHLQEIIPIA